MKTPKIGGRYVRLADGTVVPRDQAPAPKPPQPDLPKPEADQVEEPTDTQGGN